MKRLALCGAFVIELALLPVALASQHAITFNPSGYFLPMNQRNVSLVRWILLSDYPGRDRNGPMNVELRIGDSTRWTTFSQARLTINHEHVHFATYSRHGLKYEFEGRFFPTRLELSNGGFEERNRLSRAMRGVLRTLRGRHIIRSEELTFFYSMGD